MKKTQAKETMPGFVKETIGQAQKRLTLIEGQAREFVTSTWTRVRQVKTLKTLEQTLESLRQRYNQELDVTRLRRAAEDFGTENIHRALHTVGIATQSDIQSIERKVDRLRSDVRKMTSKGGRTRSKSKAAK